MVSPLFGVPARFQFRLLKRAAVSYRETASQTSSCTARSSAVVSASNIEDDKTRATTRIQSG
jgi:hypothetical protein